jgi:hypothetical protein
MLRILQGRSFTELIRPADCAVCHNYFVTFYTKIIAIVNEHFGDAERHLDDHSMGLAIEDASVMSEDLLLRESVQI